MGYQRISAQLFSTIFVYYSELVIFINRLEGHIMSCWRVLLCIIFPPLAVIDKGCGSIVIVTILTLIGWVPGVIAALIINNQ